MFLLRRSFLSLIISFRIIVFIWVWTLHLRSSFFQFTYMFRFNTLLLFPPQYLFMVFIKFIYFLYSKISISNVFRCVMPILWLGKLSPMFYFPTIFHTCLGDQPCSCIQGTIHSSYFCSCLPSFDPTYPETYDKDIGVGTLFYLVFTLIIFTYWYAFYFSGSKFVSNCAVFLCYFARAFICFSYSKSAYRFLP